MKKVLRLLTIYRVAVRYRLGELLDDFAQAKWLALLLKLPVSSTCPAELGRGARLRLALEELGPIFIKFGQLLSTRRDMIPEDIADELALLQDQVAPFDGEQAQRIIEEALQQPVSALFTDFSTTPLASASIAQVHTAKLLSGEDVVIKVIRPGIEKTIGKDIALLHKIAGLIEDRVPQGKRLRAREIIQDYEHVIFDELNMQAEAANTSQLARNFKDSDQLYIPKIYWDYCRSNILVMERIYGIPVSQVEEIKAAGINLKKLAETGVEVFFTQVFTHSFFHADMHPGNVFVSREHKESPQYIALDCAIIGTLSKEDQQYLARNLLAIFQQDYRRVAELHVECGWVPADTPINAFEATMRAVCEPIFQKPIGEISFGLLLLELFRTAGRFNMEIQPSLVLLQKTMLNIEGLGKQLYPELDLWQTALPFLERWQMERLSPLNNLKKLQEKLPQWLEQLPEIPELLYQTMQNNKNSRRDMQALLDQFEENRRLEQQARSRKMWTFGLTIAVVAVLVSQPTIGQWLETIPLASLILLGAAFSFWHFRR